MSARLKDLVKLLLERVAPQRYRSFMSRRSNRQAQWVMNLHGVPAITASFIARNGSSVLAGPFAGMAYVARSAGSSFLPKLIGSYERELHPALERIFAICFDTAIDVGSAEGYYAVGLALRLPGNPRIYAFDLDSGAQTLCQELATKNGVQDRVQVDGFCDASRLQALLGTRSLVVSDCEGFELELLDPVRAPSLRTAVILVELHEVAKPGTTAALTARFQPTHEIQLIDTEDRKPADYPAVGFLPEREQAVALSEFRNGPMQWALMIPKANR